MAITIRCRQNFIMHRHSPSPTHLGHTTCKAGTCCPKEHKRGVLCSWEESVQSARRHDEYRLSNDDSRWSAITGDDMVMISDDLASTVMNCAAWGWVVIMCYDLCWLVLVRDRGRVFKPQDGLQCKVGCPMWVLNVRIFPLACSPQSCRLDGFQ